MKKSAVLFDLGGTLILYGRRPEEVFRRILEEHGVKRSEVEIRRALNDTEPGLITSFGKIPPDEFWALWDRTVLRGLGVEDPEGVLAREIHERFNAILEPEVHKDVFPTLDELRRRGIKLGIISNGYVEEIEAVLDIVGIPKEGFDVIVGVDTVGEAKPSPAVFRRALEEINVDPGECIFVGDDARRDCEGALNAGMTPYLVVRDDKQDTDPRFRTVSSLSELIEQEYI